MTGARPKSRSHQLASVAALTLCVVSLHAETNPPRNVATFRVGVEVVNLNLSATDRKDQYVTDLGEQDLSILEDGIPQQICLFTREQLPISLAILIDSSASMQATLPVAQAAALRLVRALRPEDQAEIVQFNRRIRVVQDFTSDQAALEKAIREIRVEGETALYTALYIALKDLSALRKAGELRRRALVVLSDGEDTASPMSDDQVLELARRVEVAVYPIGLFPPRPGAVGDSGLPTYFLTALARETGGRAYFPAALAELDGVYDRVAEELRTMYGVAYIPSNPQKDGKWRRIAVETRRPNLLLRYKLGYYAR